MLIERMTGTVAESREAENTAADVAKHAAMVDYIALMTDVELPEDEETGESHGNE